MASEIMKLTSSKDAHLLPGAAQRMAQVMKAKDAVIVYGDYITPEGKVITLNPYQKGSVREGFDFGPFALIDDKISDYLDEDDNAWAEPWYAKRLRLSEQGPFIHIPEVLAVCPEMVGENQFAYVDPTNKDAQHELWKEYQRHIDLTNQRQLYFRAVDFDQDATSYQVEASVVIPVKNRVRTIADAVKSALSQETNFSFNVIVVDNGSTDGTADILAQMAAADTRLVVKTLDGTYTIGGCWNEAIYSPEAGRFVVQLDSDDLYDGTNVLQRIIDKFYDERCAMVVGSYTLTDFNGNVIAPGLINHPELDNATGANNALRVNGFGAPRAFYQPVIREIGFPNVSYGEDYAACLAVSRTWRLGRIMDSLYKCRRWEGNTDHQLSHDQKNANDYYKDWVRTLEMEQREGEEFDFEVFEKECERLFSWHGAVAGQEALEKIEKREVNMGRVAYTLLHLPMRETSARSVAGEKSPCFLCEQNRPKGQPYVDMGLFQLLANPAPIFPSHMVMASRAHEPQDSPDTVERMLQFSQVLGGEEGLVMWHNGSKCGASAREHLHFQAADFKLPRFKVQAKKTVLGDINVSAGYLGNTPCMEIEYDFTLSSIIPSVVNRWIKDEVSDFTKGMTNLILQNNKLYVIQRIAHRAPSYPEPLISPGAAEMAGYIVLPRKKDYDRLTAREVREVMEQVTEPIEYYMRLLKQYGR